MFDQTDSRKDVSLVFKRLDRRVIGVVIAAAMPARDATREQPRLWGGLI